jgi:hypothetical protein
MHMAIPPGPTSVPQVVELNQPADVANEVDDNDVPSECRLYRRSLDKMTPELPDADRDHIEYERLLNRLYLHACEQSVS